MQLPGIVLPGWVTVYTSVYTVDVMYVRLIRSAASSDSYAVSGVFHK